MRAAAASFTNEELGASDEVLAFVRRRARQSLAQGLPGQVREASVATEASMSQAQTEALVALLLIVDSESGACAVSCGPLEDPADGAYAAREVALADSLERCSSFLSSPLDRRAGQRTGQRAWQRALGREESDSDASVDSEADPLDAGFGGGSEASRRRRTFFQRKRKRWES